MILIVMGVSGSGKTTIGTLLAEKMHMEFADADQYHSSASIAKMNTGFPLTDEDRQPWLQTLNSLLQGWCHDGKRGVLACSSLKESYRKKLVQGLPDGAVHWVFLDGPKDLLAARLAARRTHFMNPHLLDSQLATMEPPSDALRFVNDKPLLEIVGKIIDHIVR